MRKVTLHLLAPAALLAFAACADRSSSTAPTTGAALERGGSNVALDDGTGAVYTLTNAIAGNAVVAFHRAADGTLSPLGTYPTGGLGAGGAIDPLASQYAVIVGGDHRFLFAVDAGSNEVSSLRVDAGGALAAVDREPSGGTRPVSLALRDHLLYVLNAGDNVVRGFRVGGSGNLTPVERGSRALASGAAGASTIQFSADGGSLIVTERTSGRLETIRVGDNGRLGEPVITASNGATPFGFDIARGHVLVAEAAGAAPNGAVSSYTLESDGALRTVTRSLSTQNRATCWLIATADGRWAYSVNSASATLSALRVGDDGSVALLDADGRTGFAGTGTAPIDPAFSADERFLYTLNGANGTIGAFRVGDDHRLTLQAGATAGSPSSGLQGLAAY